jgi:hypothetical protein
LRTSLIAIVFDFVELGLFMSRALRYSQCG